MNKVAPSYSSTLPDPIGSDATQSKSLPTLVHILPSLSPPLGANYSKRLTGALVPSVLAPYRPRVSVTWEARGRRLTTPRGGEARS